MNKHFLFSAILTLGLLAQSSAQEKAAAPAAPPTPPAPAAPATPPPVVLPPLKTPNDVKLKDGDRFIFIGDSITHQCLYTQFVEDFYYTRYPNLRLYFRNAGISGDRAQDALNRFDEDIAAFKPTVATILLGMNDGTYRDFDQATFDTYAKGMTELLDRLDAINCKVIVMSPTMFDHQAFEQMVAKDPAKGKNKTPNNYNGVLSYYGEWLREVARKRGYQFADLFGPLNELTTKNRKTDPNFTLIQDAIHPGPDGQLVMAHSLLKDIGETRGILSSGVKLIDGKWQSISPKLVKDVNGEAGKKVSYTIQPKALPWAIFKEAPLGSKLTRAGQNATQESHIVSGLSNGNYDLVINGQNVGTWDERAFAVRANIESDPESPTYQQALQVIALNKKRNDEAVRPLRNLWGKQKGWFNKRTQDPTGYEAWQTEFKAQCAVLDALADKYEAEIYQINKPQTLKIEVLPSAQPAAAPKTAVPEVKKAA